MALSPLGRNPIENSALGNIDDPLRLPTVPVTLPKRPRKTCLTVRLSITIQLDYALPQSADVLMQIEAAALPDQTVEHAFIRVDHNTALAQPGLTFPGLTRIAAQDCVGERIWFHPEEGFAVFHEARIAIDRPAEVIGNLPADSLPALPAEVVKYLFASRFCPVDTLQTTAVELFGHLKGGAAVQAICDWIGGHLSYVAGSSTASTTALDTFHSRNGVCRDYAHLLIALVRSLGIPARMVSALSPGVDPPDFHAVAQVWLAGGWHLIDATGMADPSRTAIIGVGRDAADIAFLTIFGTSALNQQSVQVTELTVN